MLTDLCQELHNWFELERHSGEFVIEEGVLSASFLQTGQYYRVRGSVWNDGVWQYGVDTLKDETFNGSVWALAIPQAVLELNTEIDEWVEKYKDVLSSPITNESLSASSYSYSKATGSEVTVADGYKAFASRLKRWRKI